MNKNVLKGSLKMEINIIHKKQTDEEAYENAQEDYANLDWVNKDHALLIVEMEVDNLTSKIKSAFNNHSSQETNGSRVEPLPPVLPISDGNSQRENTADTSGKPSEEDVNSGLQSPQVAVPTIKDDVHLKSEHNRYGGNSFKVLPLMLQSEIKQNQDNSLIKGNC